MLPRFEIVGRQRPVAVVRLPSVAEELLGGETGRESAVATPHRAPYAAIEAGLTGSGGVTTLALDGPDGTRLAVGLDGGAASLHVRAGGRETRHASRRHGRCATAPTRLGLALTGRHLSVLTLEAGAWVVRGRVDVGDRVDTRDPAWLAGLTSSVAGAVADWRAGAFGQLGLRDIRLVSHTDGAPYRVGSEVLLTATSAGPGFFDTAHTSVWALSAGGDLSWRGDLFFERPDRPGVYGDHATHLVRDGDRWLVATSTWADFPARRADRVPGALGIMVAESTEDLTRGQHVLAGRRLDLPTDGPSVGVWDPHLVRREDGGRPEWLVGYVSAKRFFDFHPVLAAGPSLDDLTLRGAATCRTATEGTTLLRIDGQWRVLASDGRDNPRAVRGRFPVFDLGLHEIGALEAPYPTNIPWPTVVPPESDTSSDGWRLVTFNGAPYGGRLAGYGTHGEVVVMRGVAG